MIMFFIQIWARAATSAIRTYSRPFGIVQVALPVGFVQQQLQVLVDSNSPAPDPRTTHSDTSQQSSSGRRIPKHSTGMTDSVIAQLEASIQPRPEREKRVPPKVLGTKPHLLDDISLPSTEQSQPDDSCSSGSSDRPPLS